MEKRKKYTIEDLENANVIVRNEYEIQIADLTNQLKDVLIRLQNVEKVLFYSDKSDTPKEAPKDFKKLDDVQVTFLKKLITNTNVQSQKEFIKSVLSQGNASEKQREIIKDIYKRVQRT